MTWACWTPVIASGGTAGSLGPLWLLGVFAPAIIALALTAVTDRAAGVRDLLAGVLHWRVGGRWYAFALGYMVVIKLAAAVVYRLTHGGWPGFGHERPVVLLVATLLSTPVQFGEEVGWRGFALPRLARRMGYGWASILLGVVWACWHLPQFFVVAADTYHQSFPIWAIEVTALSVAMAWVYARTNGSVLLTMLMHAAVNNTKDIVPSIAEHAPPTFSFRASPVLSITAALMWIAGAYFIRRMPDPQPSARPLPSEVAG